jgi:hypothetical protein
MKVTITRVMSTNRATVCTTQAEVDAFINSLTTDQFAVVELKQEVPNENLTDDGSDIFSVSYRLQGHSAAIPQKATRTLMGWFNFSKQAFEKAAFKLNAEVVGYTLKESYVPITKLDVKWGLDTKGNVTQEPIINPSKQSLLLYSVKTQGGDVDMPMFRKVDIAKGEYTPTFKPTYVDIEDDFEGNKRVNGKKTAGYQHWLNELHSQYVGDFNNIVTAENATMQTA